MHWNKTVLFRVISTWKNIGSIILVLIFMCTDYSVVNAVPRQDVVLQIVMPYQSLAENKYQSTHVRTKERIKHGREIAYRNLRRQFVIDSWLNFTQSESPAEILSLYCNQIFKKPVNTILSLNHGSGTESSNNYILQLADHLGYPVISWDPHYPGALQSNEDSRVLQIAPTIYHQCQAMQKILNRYNWTDFSLVTTKITSHVDFINCMRDMVRRTSVSQGFTTKAKYNILSSVTADIGDTDDYEQTEAAIKAALKIVKDSVSRVIILHAGDIETLDIMDAAKEIGLTDPKYVWLLTSSSIGRIGRSTTFPVGVLGIMYNETQDMIEEAMKTSIRIWAMGLEKLARNPLLSRVMMHPNHTCSNSSQEYWKKGFWLYRAMRDVVIKDPPVSFSSNGVIEYVKFNIYNVRPSTNPTYARRGWNEFTSVGTISPKEVNGKMDMRIEMDEVVWPGNAVFPPKGKPERRFFKIVTLKEPPYISYVPPDAETGTCGSHAIPCKLTVDPKKPDEYGNATINEDGLVEYCCAGLCVDLLKILSTKMNFDYEMHEVSDREWGIKQQNGEWTGLVKDMMEQKAEMVITSIKINHERATAMDFSTPFLETGITIMVALRKGAISATAFLEPYDYPSWCLILVFSVHATGASIFIFEWLSPAGLDKGRRSMREHKFSLFRSFWLIWAMLFGASVSTDNPRGMSSRFLANVWALFALVFLASYTANLAAFMITIEEYYDLSGIEDWRLMNPTAVTPHFKFATKPGGSTEDNLRKNYPRMHRYMQKYNKSEVVDGIHALKIGEIHAFIYDATVLEYLAGRDKECNLITVGKWYAMTGYGVGFPKGSPYIDEVNDIILELQNNGELDRLQKFWLAGACHAMKDKKDKTSQKIGILNFTSAFILLAAGVTLATILMLLEHFYFKFGRRCLKKYDKTGCCALVSLSMGKSLTFEQSVLDAVEYQKRHKCKDPLCETQLWTVRHELDLALIKLEKMRDDLVQIEPNCKEFTNPCIDITSEDQYKSRAPNGTSNAQSSNQNSGPLYETPDSLRQTTENHVGNSVPCDFQNRVFERPETVSPPSVGENNKNKSDLEKKRSQFRRSPSYTNAISIDSNDSKDVSTLNTIEPPPSYTEASPKRCPSYSQAVEESPLLSRNNGDKHNMKTKYFDGKYYVGVVRDTDDSAL
ncbi:glutamate receptor ionotropic, NMDA 2B-like [Mercenaria mercenaria]|uniref:glutamate receptor ionotropic, NMDA 2B-like n=1 Tax=Mercenaria mercenaria TaxID=6596 RepID=UPI00234FA6ED|nr:glutamate receptor ionotropic, NMDA 2B-like [Mercenaria mercenaria]XP_045213755.2 glutamate receptor ionotropic, NMDA 2B-like [Mercenaria mercenaria]XP_045213756.2 glutamate receptor ionotropic, NMDA 2B-like [Mercenaria mercenaria]